MKFWVGVTDRGWFERLRIQGPDEVNFWQPSARPAPAFLEPGVPFLFKLHSTDNFLVGGGFFVRFSALPARLAWEAFGAKNGVADYAELRRRIERYRGASREDPSFSRSPSATRTPGSSISSRRSSTWAAASGCWCRAGSCIRSTWSRCPRTWMLTPDNPYYSQVRLMVEPTLRSDR
jgi:hypothetical protein